MPSKKLFYQVNLDGYEEELNFSPQTLVMDYPQTRVVDYSQYQPINILWSVQPTDPPVIDLSQAWVVNYI
jgi:hypothetical protein